MSAAQRIGPLFTDLYELTMAASYFDNRIFSEATFSVFVRDTSRRNYFVAAGLEDALRELEAFQFSEDELTYLTGTGLFSEAFIDHLKGLRFTGTIHALPEGTIFFPNEPVLEVTAPLIESQIIETFILNTIGFQTNVASKGGRCVYAAKDRPLVDFSLRRTQGQDAGLKVARSTFLVGFSGTSNVLAGKQFGLPVSGTMAHSYILAFDREIDAFASFAETFPESSVFLIDTYDTLEGARNAAKVALEMQARGHALLGVRLDSGDMADLSQQVRKLLDKAGLPDVKIYASSGFDEFEIMDIISHDAQIDAFGVGTKLGVSADVPYLDIVYKLVRFNQRNIRKLSTGKVSLAGEKQIFRRIDGNGMLAEDIIGLRDDGIADAEPLLKKVMTNGRCIEASPSLKDIQSRFKKNFSQLPEEFKSILNKRNFRVKLSERLKAVQQNTD
ncbi:MAG: nicotinate phosphoribosyltransferase [Thermodesulfobacteriota bacterium]